MGERGLRYGMTTVLVGLALIVLGCCALLTFIIAVPFIVIGAIILLFEITRRGKSMLWGG